VGTSHSCREERGKRGGGGSGLTIRRGTKGGGSSTRRDRREKKKYFEPSQIEQHHLATDHRGKREKEKKKGRGKIVHDGEASPHPRRMLTDSTTFSIKKKKWDLQDLQGRKKGKGKKEGEREGGGR